MHDNLPKNSESRVLGVLCRHLRKHTSLRFILAYSDPAAGHVGTIYQASNFAYVGLSAADSLIRVGRGKAQPSRTIGQIFGSRDMGYLRGLGLDVTRVPQAAKHTYVYFLDPSWRPRLRGPALPYPKRESIDAGH
ncbi:MAG: hypothetical protein HY532_08905 [Chloroflexi bacterium]|nr:hypothetical protein [Chloroflexota bacterium]